ncbi:MAG: hypothetical protein AAFO94_13010, partial [Bacteroidota bacterium]
MVSITDAMGCTNADSLVVDPIPVPPLELGADTAICVGASLTLVAGDGTATYAWSTGETDATITVSTAGKYLVTVTN